MRNNPSPAQVYARIILSIAFLTSGIALMSAIGGRPSLSLQICFAGVITAIFLLVLGSYIVARNKPPEE
jgi:hypothetical protein